MSSRELEATALPEGHRESWDRLAHSCGCVFDTLRWTELFGGSIRRVGIYDAGGVLRGGFCVHERRVMGLPLLRNPPCTPHIGPFFESRASNAAARTDEQRAVLKAMVDYLENSAALVVSLGLSIEVRDCLPFCWQGWTVTPCYTYRLELAQDEESLLSCMSAERRKNIRKSQADGVTVDETDDLGPMRDLVVASYARQGRKADLSTILQIFKAYPPCTESYCMIAQFEGRPIAGVFIVHDSRTAYYLLGGYAADGHHGAGALAMWAAIRKAKSMGLRVFDFEGSMIPPIERYVRGFGGILTPYFAVRRAWLPIRMALMALPRCRGRF